MILTSRELEVLKAKASSRKRAMVIESEEEGDEELDNPSSKPGLSSSDDRHRKNDPLDLKPATKQTYALKEAFVAERRSRQVRPRP
jgi:hypothetical protein